MATHGLLGQPSLHLHPENTEDFSTWLVSRIEPVLKTFNGVEPVLVMVALTSVLPTTSILTWRGLSRLGVWMDKAETAELTAERQTKNFMLVALQLCWLSYLALSDLARLGLDKMTTIEFL